MRYIKGALDLNLTFTKEEKFEVRGYCDSDYAADLDKRRSIAGYVFTVGGNTVSWRSSLLKIIALSTTEAEYMSLSEAIREGIWLKGICEEYWKLDKKEVAGRSSELRRRRRRAKLVSEVRETELKGIRIFRGERSLARSEDKT
ncbi:hypothetical protein YC2023_073034 [Brassica napus]